jgi:hypothetical protein
MFRSAISLGTAAIMMALCMSTPSHAQDAADDGKLEKAKRHFAACIAFLNDPEGKRWEEAYPECKKAYELSGSLNALNNLALCAVNLELDGEAIGHYKKLLIDTDVLQTKTNLSDDDVAQLQSDLDRLDNTVAWVRINTDKPGVKLTDERTPRRGLTVRNTYDASIQGVRLGIHPGAHVFTATASGGLPEQQWKVTLENGKKYSHDFVFDKNAPVTAEGFTEADQKELTGGSTGDAGDEGVSRPVPAYVWAAAGLTVAAGGAMVGMMVGASGKKANYEKIRGVSSLAEQQAAVDDVKKANLIADVMIGVTGAAAVTTIILFATRPEAQADSSAKGGVRFGHDWMIAPAVSSHGAGAWMTAHF